MIAELQSAISKAPSRRERLKKLSRVEAVKLKVERAALLFRGAPTAIGISLVNMVITIAVAWSFVDRTVLLSWSGAVLGLGLIRIAVWLHFRFAGPSGRAIARFATFHLVFMALNGTLWGSLAPIFAVYGMSSSPFLPFIISGMAAAAVISAGASWRAVLAFNIPVLTPLAATYALTVPETGLAIATVIVLFGGATTYLALRVQAMIDRSILLHTHNTELFDALQLQADEAHLAEQRFRALVESSHDVTLIFSPDGLVTYASPSVERVLGVPPEMFIGLTTKDIVHADDIAQFRSVGEQSLSDLGSAVALAHVCMKGPEGEYTPLSGRLTNMLYVPGVEGFVFSGGAKAQAPHHHLHKAVV